MNPDIKKYIAQFPDDVSKKLAEVYKAIKSVEPESDESIRYMMPAFRLKKKDGKYAPLAYFAGYKKHIGFYPTPSPLDSFVEELKEYKTSKGAIQFPLDKKLPIGLIKRIVKFRAMSIRNS